MGRRNEIDCERGWQPFLRAKCPDCSEWPLRSLLGLVETLFWFAEADKYKFVHGGSGFCRLFSYLFGALALTAWDSELWCCKGTVLDLLRHLLPLTHPQRHLSLANAGPTRHKRHTRLWWTLGYKAFRSILPTTSQPRGVSHGTSCYRYFASVCLWCLWQDQIICIAVLFKLLSTGLRS